MTTEVERKKINLYIRTSFLIIISLLNLMRIIFTLILPLLTNILQN